MSREGVCQVNLGKLLFQVNVVSGEWVMLNQHYVDIWIYAVKLLETWAGGKHLGMCLSAAWRLHGLWPRRTFAAPNRVSVWD